MTSSPFVPAQVTRVYRATTTTGPAALPSGVCRGTPTTGPAVPMCRLSTDTECRRAPRIARRRPEHLDPPPPAPRPDSATRASGIDVLIPVSTSNPMIAGFRPLGPER